jgi:cyclic beta-1,2-glucan synthetase
VRQQLVRRDAQLILLLAPPFDRISQDPGYIRGYVPGIRENGGQYTHAAIWFVMAVAQAGAGDEAVELFHLLNPINHTRSRIDAERYRVEPYVVAADVYSHAMHVGRGGWTLYTGSAAWMYRAAIESILGVEKRGHELALRPCIPAAWDGFTVDLQVGASRYAVQVENPERMRGAVVEAMLDGVPVDPEHIPLVDDGRAHHVRAVIGTRVHHPTAPSGRRG